MSEYSAEWLAELIERLPADKEVPSGTQGYSRYHTQKAHWLGWLDKETTALNISDKMHQKEVLNLSTII